MASLKHGTINAAQADDYETLTPLLSALFREFQDLAKKKPDGMLNPQKLKLVNRLLVDIHILLEKEPSRNYLDLLDEDDVPQYSDVTILLGQTVAAMEAFHNRYYGRQEHNYSWAIK